ncbi:hypothetical protein TNCV_3444341 [Trichonephila clavipes]|nr:hypothetical protein TNCV_3444341 [Trichonephila clavipes]
MVSRQPTTEITPIYSPISTSEEIPFPLSSTSQTRDPIPFPRGLFHHDILNEALSSSGISETSISLGYHLGKRARNNRHSTKSHSSSSSDSRRRVKHKSRHSRCSNREDEAKDEMSQFVLHNIVTELVKLAITTFLSPKRGLLLNSKDKNPTIGETEAMVSPQNVIR